MTYSVTMQALVIALCLASSEACADPVLMLNEPRDIVAAQYSCDWAAGEIKSYDYLIKAFQCSQVEQCQRAMDINATCKVSGPAMAVRAFHSKLLAQFASNPQCSISIRRLGDDKSNAADTNNLEAYKQANWELNLNFAAGAAKQSWTLWPWQNGQIVTRPLDGEGDPGQIARDVCTIMTHGGAKILN
jgi:hypothetical protein